MAAAASYLAFEAEVTRIVENFVDEVAAEARTRAPRRSGRLARSIRRLPARRTSKGFDVDLSAVFYTGFVDAGTKGPRGQRPQRLIQRQLTDARINELKREILEAARDAVIDLLRREFGNDLTIDIPFGA